MNTTNKKIKYTLFKDRSEFEGEIETIPANQLCMGDFTTQWREDRNNKLPVFFEIKEIGPLGVHEIAYSYDQIKGPSIMPTRPDQEVCRLIIKKEPVIYETGATSHAVNDLILFTDNTRELAGLRDEIYMLWIEKKYEMSGYAFDELLRQSIKWYIKELGAHNSAHIQYMGKKDRDEYCRLYAADFENWKKENGYK